MLLSKAQIPLGSSRHFSTRYDTFNVSCRAHAFWPYRACRKARLDMTSSTGSKRPTSRVEMWRGEANGIWAKAAIFYVVIVLISNSGILAAQRASRRNAFIFHVTLHFEILRRTTLFGKIRDWVGRNETSNDAKALIWGAICLFWGDVLLKKWCHW